MVGDKDLPAGLYQTFLNYVVVKESTTMLLFFEPIVYLGQQRGVPANPPASPLEDKGQERFGNAVVGDGSRTGQEMDTGEGLQNAPDRVVHRFKSREYGGHCAESISISGQVLFYRMMGH
uniref:Uncharacterized protein n=1 Tax=Plectus sambesii TaxID=2011161 RepID=A0A914X920_9BILA